MPNADVEVDLGEVTLDERGTRPPAAHRPGRGGFAALLLAGAATAASTSRRSTATADGGAR